MSLPDLPIALAYIATGLAAGFIGGFLGVGGGILYVPVLDFAFRRFGIADQMAFHMALGTSLATITATSAMSAYTHHGANQVNWRAVGIMAVGGLVGVTISAQAAIGLDPRLLKALFGLLLFGVAYRFFAHAPRPADSVERNTVPRLVLVGLASAFIAGFFGVGGGIVTVPLLCMVAHYPTHRAIGTSSALIVFNSLVGMINYGGSPSAEPVPGAVGFVHIGAWIFLAAASMLTSRLGALTAHRLDPKPLRIAFAVFIVILGVRYVAGYFLS
ncbi:MAG: sulfite exporter TauE/SafE family protein [Deltaproteobacteria bacterium]|nr:sulfite exporter TauE/SafE family protein [Deltaproteobacteria bacterium]